VIITSNNFKDIIDLRRLQAQYDENFEKMKTTIGTPEHKKYVKRERKLNAETTIIKKNLGLFPTLGKRVDHGQLL